MTLVPHTVDGGPNSRRGDDRPVDFVSIPPMQLPHDQLCPGNDALQKLQQQFR